MNKRILDFKSYADNVSESAIQKYSIDQISDALDSIESDIAEYYGVSGDPNLTFDKNGEEVTISPDISDDVSAVAKSLVTFVPVYDRVILGGKLRPIMSNSRPDVADAVGAFAALKYAAE